MNFFPLNGVIGIVGNDPKELDHAILHKLRCVEIRADLLMDMGFSLNDVIELVSKTSDKKIPCLFTLRHPLHGGKFLGTEEERIQINLDALGAGASCVDLEWGTEAQFAMTEKNVPLIISHHDFQSMPTFRELDELTSKMESHDPLAIKVVPTASNLLHSVQMLKWVRNAKVVSRIGFAMGKKGTFSRILTTIYGAPITYAGFGEAIAPGQISMKNLIDIYRVPELKEDCFIYGVAGEGVKLSQALEDMNSYLNEKQLNAICIPLETNDLEELLTVMKDLNIYGVQLEDPLKDIAIQKFSCIENTSYSSVFLEFSLKKGKKVFKIQPISGIEFLQQCYI